MKSKTIILSSQKKFETNSPRAILTLINNNSTTNGKIRLYNLNNLPQNSKLGLYYNETVFSANLKKEDDSFSFLFNEDFDLNKDIYCAIIDTQNKNDVVLSGGSNMAFNFEEAETEEEQDAGNNIVETNCQTCCCENCKYKEYFYSHNKEDPNIEDKQLISATTTNKEEISNEDNKVLVNSNNEELTLEEELVETQKIESEKFLELITDQLDEMFKTYPEDRQIMNIIPNSKIIKVTDDIDDSSYIVGVLYEDNKIRYLVYGVPAKYNDTVPQEFGEDYQFLPLNLDDPMSDGYFLIYQDSTDGKIVPIKVE